MPMLDAEPDFKPGDEVVSTSKFFEGVGEVINTVGTRHGWFVRVLHQGGNGAVYSLCAPYNLEKRIHGFRSVNP